MNEEIYKEIAKKYAVGIVGRISKKCQRSSNEWHKECPEVFPKNICKKFLNKNKNELPKETFTKKNLWEFSNKLPKESAKELPKQFPNELLIKLQNKCRWNFNKIAEK